LTNCSSADDNGGQNGIHIRHWATKQYSWLLITNIECLVSVFIYGQYHGLSLGVEDNKIKDAKKYTYFASNFNHHGDEAVLLGLHHPMEHIPGFTRSHWMPPSGE